MTGIEAAEDASLDEEGTWVSESPSMRRAFELARRVADADVPVLVLGESGTGKEVIAKEIHRRGRRHGRPFLKVNCAALPGELLESELFGHEKGAFTGASADKPGKFELADKGTIFLDEIGEMPIHLQAKLLQVLQDEEFFRVGGKRSVRVDARVVVATNRELEKEIGRGAFREDLFYRLNVVAIRLPPLRERREDVPGLLAHFARRYGARYGQRGFSIPQEVSEAFAGYDWPGNVRELENLVRRLVVLEDAQPVLEELRRSGRSPVDPSPPPDEAPSLKEIGRRAAMLAEREAIRDMLQRTAWNKRRAAARLRISYKALLYKIKESGLVDPRNVLAGEADPGEQRSEGASASE